MRAWCAAVLFGLAMAVSACAHPAAGASGVEPAPEPSAGATATLADAPSIYALHPVLRDQYGGAIGLDVFRGHPVLVSMFYASCPSACPLLISNVARIDADLPAGVRAQTRVLLVSFDAEHDTPAALQATAQRHHLDPARWRLGAARDDDARALAAALGVAYHALPGGGFAHTSVIIAIDPDGRPIARADGPDADLSPLAAALERAAH